MNIDCGFWKDPKGGVTSQCKRAMRHLAVILEKEQAFYPPQETKNNLKRISTLGDIAMTFQGLREGPIGILILSCI